MIASPLPHSTGEQPILRSNRISVRRSRDYSTFSVPVLLSPHIAFAVCYNISQSFLELMRTQLLLVNYEGKSTFT